MRKRLAPRPNEWASGQNYLTRQKQRQTSQQDYWNGAHTKHRLRFHFVWVPKYRRRVLEGSVALRLDALLHQAAEVNRWQVHELAIQPDHIHLLLQIRPTESVSCVAKRLKGGTAKVLRAEFPELEEFLWGDSFWADGYFAPLSLKRLVRWKRTFGRGRLEEDVIRQYIRNQQQ